MSRYVPPHRKRVEKNDNNDAGTSNESLQREAWQALARTITGIVNRVSEENVELSATELFRENIIRGRGLLCRSLMRAQLADPDLTCVFAALVSRINKEFAIIGLLLARRLVVQWRRLQRRKDWNGLHCVSRFLGWLYIFNVVDVVIIYQIIIAHLTAEPRSDDDIGQAAALFRETFRAMSQRSAAYFHSYVLTPIRDLLAMDSDEWRLSARAQALLESCMHEVQQWERVKHTKSIIPPQLHQHLVEDSNEQKCHEVDLEEVTDGDAEEKLDRFAFDAEYDTHEGEYEMARCAVLGENWETELLEQLAVAEEETEEQEQEDQEQQQQEQQPQSAEVSKQLIDEKERQIRRDVYMAMRSSVRADEVVHKILKTMQPQTERTVCFMVIEGCCEEASYKRIYGMVAERLCKSSAKFQAFFAEAFHVRYTHAEDLEEKQIDYTCKIYVHLLRTESLSWHRCLSVLDVVDSNMSQRIIIQWLLQGLVEALGMRAVMERFEKDRELVSSTRKLFPVASSDEDVLEHAVNMFEAMQLGEMGAGVRARLDEVRRKRMGTQMSSGNFVDSNSNNYKKRRRDDMMEYI